MDISKYSYLPMLLFTVVMDNLHRATNVYYLSVSFYPLKFVNKSVIFVTKNITVTSLHNVICFSSTNPLISFSKGNKLV